MSFECRVASILKLDRAIRQEKPNEARDLKNAPIPASIANMKLTIDLPFYQRRQTPDHALRYPNVSY